VQALNRDVTMLYGYAAQSIFSKLIDIFHLGQYIFRPNHSDFTLYRVNPDFVPAGTDSSDHPAAT
jgi:hypothetical protein